MSKKQDHPKKSNRLEAKATSLKASGVSYRSYLKLTELLTSLQRILERNRHTLILALCSRARLRSRERGGNLTSLTLTWMNQGGKFFSPRSQTSKKIAIQRSSNPGYPSLPCSQFQSAGQGVSLWKCSNKLFQNSFSAQPLQVAKFQFDG